MSIQLNSGVAAGPAAGFGRHVATAIRAVIAAFVRRHKIRKTRHRLHELPNWILRDIGIHRSEIESLMVDYDAALRDDQNSTISAWDRRLP